MADGKINAKLKLALELGPLLAFFAAYMLLRERVFTIGGTEYRGFILVTAGFVPLMIVTTALLWRLTGRLAMMQVLTLFLIVVFGGLTVWFNDGDFIKMKPTMIYLIFGGLLGIGLLRGRSYLALVLDEVMPLTHEGWMALTRRLTAFFFVLAGLNELIWRNFSEETWVYFKTFGLTVAVFVFFLSQSGLLARHAPPSRKEE